MINEPFDVKKMKYPFKIKALMALMYLLLLSKVFFAVYYPLMNQWDRGVFSLIAFNTVQKAFVEFIDRMKQIAINIAWNKHMNETNPGLRFPVMNV